MSAFRDVRSFDISGPRLLSPRVFEDERGSFVEILNVSALADELGIAELFVQDNLVRSSRPGTVRALHLQAPPFAQGKLVRVSKGSILDVAVDVRRASATYGRHVTVEMSAEDLELFWVPPGFAHGYVTRAADTEVTYKTTAYYSPGDSIGIAWDDPALGIDWGVSAEAAVLSDRDRALPSLRDLDSPF